MHNFISTDSLEISEINHLIKRAREFSQQKAFSQTQLGQNHLIGLLFFEASTRTKCSFQIAGWQLGCKVIDLNLATSSVQKGESLEDTAKSLVNLGVNLLVVRHARSGAADFLAQEFQGQVGIVNAGDGSNQHPTQALLDLYTMLEHTESIAGQQITIVGDCLHSRVARSNIALLTKLGARVRLIGPASLVPAEFAGAQVEITHDLASGLPGTDFLMVLRLQKERQEENLISSPDEYSQDFQINLEVLKKAKLSTDKLKILHPGPVNWGTEMHPELKQHPIVLIDKQVQNGLFCRMAVLDSLL